MILISPYEAEEVDFGVSAQALTAPESAAKLDLRFSKGRPAMAG